MAFGTGDEYCHVPTETPEITPTSTPPIWGGQSSVIRADEEIPSMPIRMNSCPKVGDPDYGRRETRTQCAVEAFNSYRELIASTDDVMTWGRFVALVLYGEGHSVLLGRIEGGVLLLGNPQSSYLDGICWRWSIEQQQWLSGISQCEIGIQNHFPDAVTEWLFNECAYESGFSRGSYIKYENGEPILYDGTCTEDGFEAFLSQFNSLYADLADGQLSLDSDLYLPLAEAQLNEWANGQRQYGVCPCSWGNVADEQAARSGGSYNDGLSYSYFSSPVLHPGILDWFKVE